MKCLVCGHCMRLAAVEPCDEATMSGLEYRTFKCEGCGDTERRFAFDLRAALGRRPTDSSRLEVKTLIVPVAPRRARQRPVLAADTSVCLISM
jgi:hypothetical protein